MSWKAYNDLLLGSDSDRLRKLLVRDDLLKKALQVPGDIVECGVFKGTGLFTWGKLCKIYGVKRRLVGFDLFSTFAPQATVEENQQVARLSKWAGFKGIDPEELKVKAIAAGFKVELIEGMIEDTAPAYAEKYCNTRIALLNLDLDFYGPTLDAIEALWPLVTPGGIVIFDEYGVGEFTEAAAIDEFFEGRKQELKVVSWANSPTAYVKKS